MADVCSQEELVGFVKEALYKHVRHVYREMRTAATENQLRTALGHCLREEGPPLWFEVSEEAPIPIIMSTPRGVAITVGKNACDLFVTIQHECQKHTTAHNHNIIVEIKREKPIESKIGAALKQARDYAYMHNMNNVYTKAKQVTCIAAVVFPSPAADEGAEPVVRVEPWEML
jgi:hypothetical protein